MSRPSTIFGAALLGMSFNDVPTVAQALCTLKDCGITHVDTAARYPPMMKGESERLLGEARAAEKGFTIDSKILMGSGQGELEASAVVKSLTESLQRLGVQHVNTLYLHRYDPITPLEVQAATFNEQYNKGMFKQVSHESIHTAAIMGFLANMAQLGVCRFEPDQLEALLEICRANDYVRPSVYQGEYNVISRGMEQRILPILRTHNMKYYAHRALATGFLTGKFTNGHYSGTRFGDDHPLHQIFRDEYDHPVLHRAIKMIEAAGKEDGIDVRDAALRWIFYHSMLGEQDAIIIGCTQLEQIREDAQSIARGPLPNPLADAVEGVWSAVSDTRGKVL